MHKSMCTFGDAWSAHGRVAVLEWPAGLVTFHVVHYDYTGAKRALRSRGLSVHSYPTADLRRYVRRRGEVHGW
jgi:hypothetical protein